MNIQKKKIDIEKWNRKEIYEFFKTYDNPFFQITANLDISELKRFVLETNTSLFLSFLFLSRQVINDVQELNYRIEDDEVFCYEETHVSTTVLKDDHTFGIVALESYSGFAEFSENARRRLDEAKQSKAFFIGENPNNTIHYTVVPWISFTAIQHARKYHIPDSSPKVAFGKFFSEKDKIYIPFAIDVHHALADGYQAGQVFENLQACFNAPEKYLK